MNFVYRINKFVSQPSPDNVQLIREAGEFAIQESLPELIKFIETDGKDISNYWTARRVWEAITELSFIPEPQIDRLLNLLFAEPWVFDERVIPHLVCLLEMMAKEAGISDWFLSALNHDHWRVRVVGIRSFVAALEWWDPEQVDRVIGSVMQHARADEKDACLKTISPIYDCLPDSSKNRLPDRPWNLLSREQRDIGLQLDQDFGTCRLVI